MAESKAAGSRWAKRLGRRLGEVVRVRGLTQEDFAAEVGITKSSLSGWLTGGAVPRGDSLARIAEKFDVSVDWLLTGNRHDGEPSAEPVFRGQWRDKPMLAADLAAYVKREVAGHPIPAIAGMLDAHSGSHLVFDDEDFLAMAVDAMTKTIRRHVGEEFIALMSNRVTWTKKKASTP